MTSEFKTKNGESSFPRVFSANLRGPAVPRGSVSMENSMLTLYSCSYYMMSGFPSRAENVSQDRDAYLLQCCRHDIGAVIDSQNNVCNTSSCQALHLMENHGPIGEFDQWLGERESLASVRR